jgi:hypothetical protein
MANIQGEFFRGVMGDLVFRVVNGRQIVQKRVAPGTIKHTSATKRSSKTFGRAATFAAQLRDTVSAQIKNRPYTGMPSQLNGRMFSALSAMPSSNKNNLLPGEKMFEGLEGFEMNAEHPLKRKLSQLPAIQLENEELIVAFPELTVPELLKFPYNSDRCKLSVTVSLFRLQDGKRVKRSLVQDEILLQALAPFEAFSFRYIVPQSCFYVVILWMEFSDFMTTGSKIKRDPGLDAACICQARIASGGYTGKDNYLWVDAITI